MRVMVTPTLKEEARRAGNWSDIGRFNKVKFKEKKLIKKKIAVGFLTGSCVICLFYACISEFIFK